MTSYYQGQTGSSYDRQMISNFIILLVKPDKNAAEGVTCDCQASHPEVLAILIQ